jgi:hypothetical protein
VFKKNYMKHVVYVQPAKRLEGEEEERKNMIERIN